jgi:hypothetical protein
MELTKTYAYVRDLVDDAPWVALYPSRQDLDLEPADLSGSYRVIYQHSFEPEDWNYPALADGEVLLFHPEYGLVIVQSIDLNYYSVSLDNAVVV